MAQDTTKQNDYQANQSQQNQNQANAKNDKKMSGKVSSNGKSIELLPSRCSDQNGSQDSMQCRLSDELTTVQKSQLLPSRLETESSPSDVAVNKRT